MIRGTKRPRVSDGSDTPRFGGSDVQPSLLGKIANRFLGGSNESLASTTSGSETCVAAEFTAGGAPTFTLLPDLCGTELGGRVVFVTDEYFGPAASILEDGECVWSTRRRRASGHDWCVVELGRPGRIVGLEIDCTGLGESMAPQVSVEVGLMSHDLEAKMIQLGTSQHPMLCDLVKGQEAGNRTRLRVRSTFQNHEPLPEDLLASMDGLLDSQAWDEILPLTRLRPAANYFAIDCQGDLKVDTLRLNLHPDGAIRRLRVFGAVKLPVSLLRLEESEAPIDYAAAHWGAWPLWASNGNSTVRNLALANHPGAPLPTQTKVVKKPNQPRHTDSASSLPSDSASYNWVTPRHPLRPPIILATAKMTTEESAIIRLGQRCVPTKLEIDCSCVRGSSPALVHVEAADSPEMFALPLLAQLNNPQLHALSWMPLALHLPLADLQCAVVRFEPSSVGTEDSTPMAKKECDAPLLLPPGLTGITHLKISIVPDGEVSALRLYGNVSRNAAPTAANVKCRRRSTAQLMMNLNHTFQPQ